MKEVTYEDWQKNPTPRMMWVEFSSDKWFCGNKEVNVITWKEIVLTKEI